MTRNDTQEILNTIWQALEGYRENCISGAGGNQEWDEICTAMAWITEDLEGNS